MDDVTAQYCIKESFWHYRYYRKEKLSFFWIRLLPRCRKRIFILGLSLLHLSEICLIRAYFKRQIIFIETEAFRLPGFPRIYFSDLNNLKLQQQHQKEYATCFGFEKSFTALESSN